MMSDLSWLCPVPLSVESAQSLISTLPEPEFIDSNLPGYKLASKTVNYPGIEQRWLVVQSQERRESDLGKLSQRITKAQSKAVQDFKNLSPEKFACEADAIKELSKLLKQFILCRQYFPKKSRENRVPGNDYGFISAGLYFRATTN
jgi:transposase